MLDISLSCVSGLREFAELASAADMPSGRPCRSSARSSAINSVGVVGQQPHRVSKRNRVANPLFGLYTP